MNLKKILFPTDFSSCSDAGIGFATALARDSGATLLIAHAAELPASYDGAMYYGLPQPDDGELRRMLEAVVPTDPAVPFEYRLLTGNPGPAIVELAADEGVDLIVMGTHGRTGLRRMLLGSVAEQVLRRAPCPVLTLKEPSHQAAARH